jgi:tRNA modification GTPase
VAHQPHPRGRGAGEGPPLRRGGETIAAVATPPGRGGVGIVRISGERAAEICQRIAGRVPQPRTATFTRFEGEGGVLLDEGLAVYFPAPHSYTGEDVVELQGHGGPVVMHELLARCVALGARMAMPGEFTRRAFLNDRLDLAQAESVADLIDASSVEAARSAARSLSGEFSRRIHDLVASLVELRMHVEACIDFPEEEIDPADRVAQARKLAAIRQALDQLLAEAAQGAVLREGLTVVLAGRPNVGKSSLLNRLAGEDLAIVTPIPGTTRDYVRATISLEGVPIHLVDTAGLRRASDEVERLGVERTWAALEGAGAALFMMEAGGDADPADEALLARMPAGVPVLRVVNKIDLLRDGAGSGNDPDAVRISARTGEGVEALRRRLLEIAGWKPHGEGIFMARARHVEALREAAAHLDQAAETQAYELHAENLRCALSALGRITGEVSADDLLGEIFSRFCIGK